MSSSLFLGSNLGPKVFIKIAPTGAHITIDKIAVDRIMLPYSTYLGPSLWDFALVRKTALKEA